MASTVPNNQAANKRNREANCETVRRLAVAGGLQGVKRMDICRASGLSRPTVQKYLVELRKAGKVDRSHPKGTATRWGPPGISEAYQAKRDAYARKAAEDKARYAMNKTAYEWANHWSEQMPAHVCVSANDVPPLRPAGPNSVWSLAA